MGHWEQSRLQYCTIMSSIIDYQLHDSRVAATYNRILKSKVSSRPLNGAIVEWPVFVERVLAVLGESRSCKDDTLRCVLPVEISWGKSLVLKELTPELRNEMEFLMKSLSKTNGQVRAVHWPPLASDLHRKSGIK